MTLFLKKCKISLDEITFNKIVKLFQDYKNRVINDEVIIIKINQYLKNYEILENKYVYKISNNPNEFWDNIFYVFTLKNKEKGSNLNDFLKNKIKEDKKMLNKTNILDKYKNSNKNNANKNKKICFQEEKELE